jgi:hypothetical protein
MTHKDGSLDIDSSPEEHLELSLTLLEQADDGKTEENDRLVFSISALAHAQIAITKTVLD